MGHLRVVIGLIREWRDADFALRNTTFATDDELDAARIRLKKASNALREWPDTL